MIEGAAAVGFAEPGASHGLVFAGVAGGRGGGAGCHKKASLWGLYTAGGGEKRSKLQVAGGRWWDGRVVTFRQRAVKQTGTISKTRHQQ